MVSEILCIVGVNLFPINDYLTFIASKFKSLFLQLVGRWSSYLRYSREQKSPLWGVEEFWFRLYKGSMLDE